MLIAKPEQIIENENGTAFKLAGGTLICARIIKIQQGSSSGTYKFADEFVSVPAIFLSNIFSYSSAVQWSVSAMKTSEVTVHAHNIPPTGSMDAYMLAIGRWK